MTLKLQKKIISLVSLVVLLVVIFSCHFGIWNAIFSNSSVNHHVMNTTLDCCSNSHQSAGVTSYSFDVGDFALPTNKLLLALLLTVVSFILFNLISTIIQTAVSFYFRLTRIKYGGFKLFYYLPYIFSAGILHPKIY